MFYWDFYILKKEMECYVQSLYILSKIFNEMKTEPYNENRNGIPFDSSEIWVISTLCSIRKSRKIAFPNLNYLVKLVPSLSLDIFQEKRGRYLSLTFSFLS